MAGAKGVPQMKRTEVSGQTGMTPIEKGEDLKTTAVGGCAQRIPTARVVERLHPKTVRVT